MFNLISSNDADDKSDIDQLLARLSTENQFIVDIVQIYSVIPSCIREKIHRLSLPYHASLTYFYERPERMILCKVIFRNYRPHPPPRGFALREGLKLKRVREYEGQVEMHENISKWLEWLCCICSIMISIVHFTYRFHH